jgi:hypothetical protein
VNQADLPAALLAPQLQQPVVVLEDVDHGAQSSTRLVTGSNGSEAQEAPRRYVILKPPRPRELLANPLAKGTARSQR